MHAKACEGKDMVHVTPAKDTTSRLLRLPPELRHMIFSFAVAENDISFAAFKEPVLLQVSKQVRSEAREAWFLEAELTILIGSNFVDRARLRKQPGSSFDFEHIERLRETTGVIEIGHHTNSFFKTLRPELIFRNVKFQIYNEASMKHTRQHDRKLRRPTAYSEAAANRILRDRKSLIVASLSLSYTNRTLRLNGSHGESHPDRRITKPTMRPQGPFPYDACDISATVEAVVRRAIQNLDDKEFKGFTIENLTSIASKFLFLTPRARFRDAVLRVMEMQAN